MILLFWNENSFRFLLAMEINKKSLVFLQSLPQASHPVPALWTNNNNSFRPSFFLVAECAKGFIVTKTNLINKPRADVSGASFCKAI